MLASIIIFALVYAAIISEKINKTIAALLGAVAVIVFHLVPYKVAIEAVDLNVIFLLVGMMTCVYILSKTGFFEWTAISIAKLMRGNAIAILILFLALTSLFSAFLDNVTTIILLAPVTILITQILEISAAPFLILEAIVSNIGGTSTLIGDPPNIIIGSKADLSFNDFLINLGPIVIVIFLVFIITNFLIFKKRLKVPQLVRARVLGAIPHLAITDKKNMIRSLIIFGFVILGFFLHSFLHIQAGIIAIAGAAVMLFVCKSDEEATLKSVEWSVIFFFIGLFIIISSLEYNGLFEIFSKNLIKISSGNLFFTCMILLWGSAFASAIFDNIPFIIAMTPMVQKVIVFYSSMTGITDPHAIQMQIAHPLWWSLALGVCLGGNGTLIGASANVVVSQIGNKNNIPITFKKFFKYGFPFMIQSVLISSILIWLRYF